MLEFGPRLPQTPKKVDAIEKKSDHLTAIEVADKLKANPDDRSALSRWHDEKEAWVMRAADLPERQKRALQKAMLASVIYVESGIFDTNDLIENYEADLQIARNLKDSVAFDFIWSELDRLEKRI